jgi:aspartyl-tRNA synthetase
MLEKNAKARIWAIPAPTGGSRAFCDRMNSWAQSEGQPGLGYIFFSAEKGPDEGDLRDSLMRAFEQRGYDEVARKEALRDWVAGRGPVAKNLGPELTEEIRAQLGLKAGDAVFFVAGDPAMFYRFAGDARVKIGNELNLTQKDRFELCWIVDFPFYELSEEDKKIEFSHNPFSMPQGGMEALSGAGSNEDLLALKAYQYDMVCNGYEIASGAIRNHRPELMYKAFEIAGYGPEVVDSRFGGMIRALKFGAPPHGGMAAGIDRIVMLLCGAQNLREITLFPMNQKAEDLLMGAPSEVSAKQLQELHIRLNLPKK